MSPECCSKVLGVPRVWVRYREGSLGLVNDKDSTNILNLLPTYACYYFTQANIHRALDANELKQQANKIGLHGNAYNSVIEAKIAAIYNAKNNDLVFIGGSNFRNEGDK